MEAALNGPNGRIVLGPTPLTIGRTPDNQLVINNPRTSSHHAQIRQDGQGYSITDLGSTNGTFVNGQRLTPQVARQLNPGDSIRIGDAQYTYEGGSGSDYGSTIYAGPGQGSGFDETLPAAPFPQPQSTAYGANAMQGYQSSSPNYPPYNAGAQPPYAAPGAQQYNAGAPSSYPGAQPSYPLPPAPDAAYAQPSPSYTPPPPPVYNPSQPAYSPVSQASGAGFPNYSAVPPQAPQVSQAPQSPKRRSTGLIVLIAAIVLLLILGSAGLLVVHNNQVQLDNQHATATAVQGSHLTATAQVFATQTAVVNAQATATASVIAANPNPYPPQTGTLALIDPLKDNSAGYGWAEQTVGSSGSCGFNGGAYHVSDTDKTALVYCVAGNTNFSDFAYQVTMTIDKGDCGGLVFRADVNSNSFYNFLVCQDGSLNMSVYSNNNNGTILLQPKSSPAIQTGLNQQNVIGVVAQGSSINLYVNNQNVGSVTDSTLTSGSIGLIAEAVNSASDAAYSNAKVWKL